MQDPHLEETDTTSCCWTLTKNSTKVKSVCLTSVVGAALSDDTLFASSGHKSKIRQPKISLKYIVYFGKGAIYFLFHL